MLNDIKARREYVRPLRSGFSVQINQMDNVMIVETHIYGYVAEDKYESTMGNNAALFYTYVAGDIDYLLDKVEQQQIVMGRVLDTLKIANPPQLYDVEDAIRELEIALEEK